MIIDAIESYIEHYNQSINQKNKQTYGEVFTPFTLVRTMVESIPIHIWRNPRLQWLDPANGTGHFMMIVFSRLWRELREWEPDDLKRETHILTKMLFMVEINETNVDFSRQLFGEKANIYHQSFFTYDQTFDIVVGNPPFNISREKTCGKTQWQLFVKRILYHTLRSNGLFLFMTPPSWRKPCPDKSINHHLYSLLVKQNQMLYLSIQNKKQGMRDLGCNTRYDWYLVEKKNCYKHTILYDEYNVRCELYLPFYTWLPNSKMKVVMNLLAKRGETRLPVLYDRVAYKADQKDLPLDKQWVSEYENDKYPFPLIHSTPKKGIQYRFSSVCDRGHFGIPKVIFGEGGAHHCVLDIKGEYGMTHGAMAIVVNDKEEGKLLQDIILSDRFKKLMDACCFSSYRMDWNVLSLLHKDKFMRLLTKK
tara:strand:+ start:1915 stop:3174 length:1260 start_codon:yes stop_codon:yes gene_type:complete